MKTFFSLLILCAAFANANATIVLRDNFTYANGVLTNVSAGKWTHTAGGANEVNVASGHVELTRSETEDVEAALSSSFSATSGIVLYTRFTVFVTSLPTGADGNYFAHFGSTQRGKVFATTNGAAAGKFRLGISSSSNVATNTSADLNTNQTYTVVTRLMVSNAQARLWVNPAGESDSSVAAADTASGVTASVFAWRQDTGMANLNVDDLVIATSFLEALSGNESPSISDIPDQQAVESSGTVPVPFTIGDLESSANALSLHASAVFGGFPKEIGIVGETFLRGEIPILLGVKMRDVRVEENNIRAAHVQIAVNVVLRSPCTRASIIE